MLQLPLSTAMPRLLPIVPRYTDRKGRPIGHALFTPSTDVPIAYDPPSRKSNVLPLSNALDFFIPSPPSPPSTATSDTTQMWPQTTLQLSGAIPATAFESGHTQVPAVSWSTSIHKPIRETARSLDQAKRDIGGGVASPPFVKTHTPTSRYDLPAQIQGVGGRFSAAMVIASIRSLLEQERHSPDEWKGKIVSALRLEVMDLARNTFSACHDIAPSMGDLVSGNNAWAIAAIKANEVADLLIQLTAMRVVTTSDVVVASVIAFQNRRRRGYLLLTRTILEAAECFNIRFSDVKYLQKHVTEPLRAEGGRHAEAIIRIIHMAQKRYNVA